VCLGCIPTNSLIFVFFLTGIDGGLILRGISGQKTLNKGVVLITQHSQRRPIFHEVKGVLLGEPVFKKAAFHTGTAFLLLVG
jgi:hypothetical protein